MNKSFRIGEVCKQLDIQPYVLRYWEGEFSALRQADDRSGNQRSYSEDEVTAIRRIKELLYDEGYTIAGAKKKLENEFLAGSGNRRENAGATAAGAASLAPASISKERGRVQEIQSPSDEPTLPIRESHFVDSRKTKNAGTPDHGNGGLARPAAVRALQEIRAQAVAVLRLAKELRPRPR